MDFGLAKRCGAEVTTVGTVMGTPAYMAPEQAKGDTKNIGPAADVYALGVILYECLCGSVPFKGEPWSVILQVVFDQPEPVSRRSRTTPRELDLICRKCLEKEPSERYASAGELAADLRRFLNHEAIRGPRTSLRYRGRKLVQRVWRPAVAVAVFLAVTLSALQFMPRKHKTPVESTDPARMQLQEEVKNLVHQLRSTPPAPDRIPPHEATRVIELPTPDHSHFRTHRDERIMDMRGWRPVSSGQESSCVFLTRRELTKMTPTETLRVQTRMPGRDVVTRAVAPNPDKARAFALDEPGELVRHLVFDVQEIAIGQKFTLRYNSTVWNSPQSNDDSWFEARCREEAEKLAVVLLFPETRPFHDYHFRVAAANATDPDQYDELRAYSAPVHTVEAEDKSWLYWEIPNPKANYFYRIDWTW